MEPLKYSILKKRVCITVVMLKTQFVKIILRPNRLCMFMDVCCHTKLLKLNENSLLQNPVVWIQVGSKSAFYFLFSLRLHIIFKLVTSFVLFESEKLNCKTSSSDIVLTQWLYATGLVSFLTCSYRAQFKPLLGNENSHWIYIINQKKMPWIYCLTLCCNHNGTTSAVITSPACFKSAGQFYCNQC